MPAEEYARRIRRNRMWMFVVLCFIAAAGTGLYFYMKHVEQYWMSEHRHSFMGYVTENHIGTLSEIDSGTGLDAMSYELTVHHPVPDNQKMSFALDMMQHYAEYDRGTVLTILYQNDKTGRKTPFAEVHFNPVNHTVVANVHDDTGKTQIAYQNVTW